MFSKLPPREITNMIQFPEGPEEELNPTHEYNRLLHKMELRRKKQNTTGKNNTEYQKITESLIEY